MLSNLWNAYVHYSSVVAHNPAFIYAMGLGTGASGMFAYIEAKKNLAPALKK